MTRAKILLLIISLMPVTVLAETKEADKVFITAFGAAMAASLCSDIASVTSNGDRPPELEHIAKFCEDKGKDSKAVVDDYLNASKL